MRMTFGQAWRQFRGPYARPLSSVALMLVIVLGAQVFGWWHARAVVAQDLRAQIEQAGRANVAVHLGFAPEQYNLLFLQGQGRLAQFNGATVYLRDVNAAEVDAIGSQYWVTRVDRWQP
jgi:hypothetical protein